MCTQVSTHTSGLKPQRRVCPARLALSITPLISICKLGNGRLDEEEVGWFQAAPGRLRMLSTPSAEILRSCSFSAVFARVVLLVLS